NANLRHASGYDGTCNLEVARASEELFEGDAQLQTSQRSPRAVMRASTEGQTLSDVRPVQDELIGPLEDLLIAIRRRVHQCDRLALFDGATVQLHVAIGRARKAAVRSV